MFWKMSLIEGIGDEVTQFFVALFTIVVLYVAWRSTNVREDSRLQRTAVLIIENNRRRLTNRVAQHPVTISILRNSTGQVTNTEELDANGDDTNSSQVEDIDTIQEPPNLLSVLDEINNLSAGQLQTQDLIDIEDSPEEIIRAMDNDEATGDGLRNRRSAFYQNSSNQTTIEELIDLPESDNETTNSDNCSNENNENTNITRTMSPNKVENNSTPSSSQSETKESLNAPETPEPSVPQLNEIEMRIKLKYLNDDLKIVIAQPNEALGEFKKRHFTVELAAQKYVRLVFNGHVLQPETKSLKACGLFDNCVVHCLVHNQKPQSQAQGADADGTQQNRHDDLDGGAIIDLNHGDRDRMSRNEPLLIYLGMCLISLILVCAWYCRFRYNYLFSWYSTAGLILMTALFLFMIPINVFLEREATG